MNVNEDRRSNNWFSKQAIISSLIPTISAIIIVGIGMNKQLALIEQKMTTFETSLADVRNQSVSKVEFEALVAVVTLKHDDPYHGSDALKDFKFRDFRIDKLENKYSIIESYLYVLHPNWKNRAEQME